MKLFSTISFVFSILLISSASDVTEINLNDLASASAVDIHGDFDHVQGIDVDGDYLWFTSVHREDKTGWLHLYNRKSGELIKQVEVQEEGRYHPGGLQLDGDSVWIPVAVYSREGTSTIERRDSATLELRSRFLVQDHIGCVAVNETQVIGGNWDARALYIWDKSGGLMQELKNPRDAHYQDMKWMDGMLVASGKENGKGVIDWLTLPKLELVRRITAGETDRGVSFMNEGMALLKGNLFLFPEDGPHSRLFEFELKR